MAKVPKEVVKEKVTKPKASKVSEPVKVPALTIREICHLGCDPEFFFKKGNRIVGAEMFLPKEGKVFKNVPGTYGNSGKFIIDGVQAELNPEASTCRALLFNNISQSFRAMKKELIDSSKTPIAIHWGTKAVISKTELAKLDPNNQVFGCTPSFSAYPNDKSCLADVNPLEYRVRAAGGHIHIGSATIVGMVKKGDDMTNTVRLLDLIVGNTCVLMDRDVGNKERRKLYGRAGEYRLPPHGLEYRTPSNFWLHNSAIASIVFGLVRLSISISLYYPASIEKIFLDSVPEKDIVDAINNNSYSLALKNYKKIRHLIGNATSYHSATAFGIDGSYLDEFDHFHTMINKHGLGYWFKEDPLTHWVKNRDTHDGADSASYFLGRIVRDDRLKKKN